MKRIFVVGMIGAWSALGLFVAACGGDDSVNKDGGNGTDATIDDTGTGTDTGMTGMDGNMDDTGMTGMDGSMGTDGGGGGGSNPGKVNCGQSVQAMECDAGGNGCCVHFLQDGGSNYQCVNMGGCGNGGVRWYCDERADCMNNDSCCVFSFQGVTEKQCFAFCGNGSARSCKSPADCVDGGACNTYTCPGNVQVQACTKPNNCN